MVAVWAAWVEWAEWTCNAAVSPRAETPKSSKQTPHGASLAGFFIYTEFFITTHDESTANLTV